MGRRVIFYCCNTVTSKTSGLFIDHIWHLIQHVLNICKWCCGACCFWRRYSHWTFCDNTWTRNQLQYRSAVVWSHRSLWHPQSRSNFAQSRTWPYDDCQWRQSSLLEIICRGISVSPYRKADCWRCITLTCHCCNLLIDLFHRCTGISILHVYSRLTVVPQTPPRKHFLLAILLSYQQHQSIEYMLLRLMEPVASTNFK